MRRVEPVWGTAVGVDVRDPLEPDVLTPALDSVFAWFARVDDLFSTWRDDTEIVRIGQGDLAVEDASAEVRTVLDLCERVRRETDGAFDATVGARAKVAPRPGLAPLDPSGLVKGWAAERAATILYDAGARAFSINAGGDVVVRGGPEPGAPWRIGIRHPWDAGKVAAVVAVVDLGVATSGVYERGDHVLDPRTGLPATGPASVTVIGPDLTLADAYATAIVVMGVDGLRWIEGVPGYEAMAITDERRVVSTPGFARHRVASD